MLTILDKYCLHFIDVSFFSFLVDGASQPIVLHIKTVLTLDVCCLIREEVCSCLKSNVQLLVTRINHIQVWNQKMTEK